MIVPMKHITLFALKRDEASIMKALQCANVVEVVKSAVDGDALLDEAGEFLHQCEKELADRENDLSRINAALNRLAVFIEKESLIASFTTPQPEADADELDAAVEGALAVTDKLDEILNEIAQRKSDMDKRNAIISQLQPFIDMDIELGDIHPTRYVNMLTGTVRADRLHILDEAGIAYEAFGDSGTVAAIVAVPKSETEEANSVLKSVAFAEVVLPPLDGTPAQNILALEGEMAAINFELMDRCADIEKLAENAELLKQGFDGALIARDRAKARLELFSTRETFMLTGWVRSDEVGRFTSALDSVTQIYCVDMRDPFDEEKPPTAVKNSKFFAPFTFVTDMYSPPDPRGYDPTTVMAPFYLLFFGLMMSDTGYGAVISLACALVLKLKKPTGGFEKICRILVWGGLSTMVCGLFTGTCFGLNWSDIFGEGFPFPLLDSMDDPMTALIFYCGLGFVQIVTGMIISIVLHVKAGDWQTALFDIGSWLMIFAGLGLAFVLKGVAVYAAYGLIGVGILLIITFGGRSKRGLSRITSGLGKLYDITGFFSDVLSYSRVFALGLATGVMGSVFNMIGGMINDAFAGIPVVGGILGFIVAGALLVVLHIFCISINALGAFIHCARLQFIEYYNRFYTPDGRIFAPLGFKTKHNRVRQ